MLAPDRDGRAAQGGVHELLVAARDLPANPPASPGGALASVTTIRTNDKLPADLLAGSPAAPANLASDLIVDEGFWHDNRPGSTSSSRLGWRRERAGRASHALPARDGQAWFCSGATLRVTIWVVKKGIAISI